MPFESFGLQINDKDANGTAGILGQHIAFFSNIVMIRIKRNAKASRFSRA